MSPTLRETKTLGVIIPTRNARRHLVKHVERLSNWISLASEVLLVDSDSTDGSVEYIIQHIPSARTISTSPGIYEAWNIGARHLNTDYVYIATVGDLTSRDGVLELIAQATRFRADLVMSPPNVVFDGDAVGEIFNWPIHMLLRYCRIRMPELLSPLTLFAACVAHLPECMLGSVASTLFRRETLLRWPFTSKLGHYSDVDWLVRACLSIRTVVIPSRIATFLLHGQESWSEEVRLKATLHCLAEADTQLKRYRAQVLSANPIHDDLAALIQYRRQLTDTQHKQKDGDHAPTRSLNLLNLAMGHIHSIQENLMLDSEFSQVALHECARIP